MWEPTKGENFVMDEEGRMVDFVTGEVQPEPSHSLLLLVVILKNLIRHLGKNKSTRLVIRCWVETGLPKDMAMAKLREFIQSSRPDFKPDQIDIEQFQFHSDNHDWDRIYGDVKIGPSGCYGFRFEWDLLNRSLE